MTTYHCNACGDPLDVHFKDLVNGAFALCPDCAPSTTVEKPTVHLYGAPDGQELARWTDVDIDPRLASEQGRRSR